MLGDTLVLWVHQDYWDEELLMANHPFLLVLLAIPLISLSTSPWNKPKLIKPTRGQLTILCNVFSYLPESKPLSGTTQSHLIGFVPKVGLHSWCPSFQPKLYIMSLLLVSLLFQEAYREEQLVNRLMRQSQQERRIAVQLMHVRHEKEVLWQNRIYREKQFEERRLKEFQEALDREEVDIHYCLICYYIFLFCISLPKCWVLAKPPENVIMWPWDIANGHKCGHVAKHPEFSHMTMGRQPSELQVRVHNNVKVEVFL